MVNLRVLFAVLFLLTLIGVGISGIGLAEEEQEVISEVHLQKGKNHIELESSLFVRELVAMNSEIESVSYFDVFLNKNVGYVNVFGGVGDNFLMKPGEVYEISVSDDINLVT
ncbi:MAG: hypothetical protein ABIH92_01525 [Nanoarchaeota archaeon]